MYLVCIVVWLVALFTIAVGIVYFGSLYLPSSELDYDPERFADQELPILIVGTKLVCRH